MTVSSSLTPARIARTSQQSKPEVSVLMPVYNSARYLPAALSSILSQSFKSFELIVIDDGSTDATPAVLAEFALRDARMHLTTRENRGTVFTRNELLNRATADLIAWMDSDDVAVPERLAIQVEQFRNNSELVCIGSSCLLVDPEGLPLHVEAFPLTDADIRAAQWQGGGIRFGTSMMRTAPALVVGGFREPFAIGEDLDFLMRLGEHGRLANLEQILLHYRRHPKSASARLEAEWTKYRRTILSLARERAQGGRDSLQQSGSTTISENEQRPVPLFARHVHWARLALASGYGESARKHALKAVRLAPGSMLAWRTLARVFTRSTRMLRPTAAVGFTQMGVAAEWLSNFGLLL